MNKTNMFKKALSAVLVLMMVLTSLTIVPFTTGATTTDDWDTREDGAITWNGTDAKTPAGVGSASFPIRITTPNELQGLKAAIDASEESTVYIKLMNDLNMAGQTFTTLASTSKNFVFEGNDKIIFNLTIGSEDPTHTNYTDDTITTWNNNALFKETKGTVTFRNLTVKATVYGKNQAGILIAYSNGGVVTFDNIHTLGKVHSFGDQASPLTAYMGTSSTGLIIKNCVNEASVSAGKRAAGLVCRVYIKSGNTLLVENCENKGAIETRVKMTALQSYQESSCYGAGGLFGSIYLCNGAPTAYIRNCVNNGVVNGAGVAGGVVASINAFPHTDRRRTYETAFELEYCINNVAVSGGTINATATKGSKGTGGIVGTLTSCGADFAFRGCVNNGDIMTTENNLGGMVGGLYYLYNSDMLFTGCANTGKLTMNYTRDVANNMVCIGGMTGQLRAEATYPCTLTFNYCYDNSDRDTSVITEKTFTNKPTIHNRGLEGWSTNQTNQISKRTVTNCYVAPKTAGSYTHGTYSISLAIGTSATASAKIANLNAAIVGMKTLAGKGTEAEPYKIGTRAELDAFAGIAFFKTAPEDKVYAELTASIDMSGKEHTPIAATATVHLNGKNFAITNMTVGEAKTETTDGRYVKNAGLFAEVGANSSFKNLKMLDVAVYGSDQAAALVSVGASGLTFYNIYTSGELLSTGSNAGALVGYTSKDSANDANTYDVSYCVNEATSTAKTYAGGLFGDVSGAINWKVSYCVNLGDLTTTAETGTTSLGGIVAHAGRGANVATTPYFKNCYNKGDMTANLIADNNGAVNPTTYYSFMGGVVGWIQVGNPGGNSTVLIQDCYDVSERYNKKGTLRNGGVLGNGDRDQFASEGKHVLECYSYTVTYTVDLETGAATKNNTTAKISGVEDATTKIENSSAVAEDDETMLAGIQAIDDAIAGLLIPTLVLEDNTGVALKLSEPFGMMTITNIKLNGENVSVAEYGNYFKEYGFIYYAVEADADAPTPDAMKASENRVKGKLYSNETVDGAAVGYTDGNYFFATYTELTASHLNTDVYCASYVIIGDEIYISDSLMLNPYTIAKDYTADNSVITDPDEKLVYEKMVAYYDAYKAYLDSLN